MLLPCILVAGAAVAFQLFGLEALGVACIFSVFALLRYLRFVGKDEQLHLALLTDMTVINGPTIKFLPLLYRSVKTRKAIAMDKMQFCIVNDTIANERRVEVGPKLLFLGAYDEVVGGVQAVVSLKATEYVRYLDKATGKIRVERGEQGRVIPGPHEVVLDGGKRAATHLKVYEYVRIEDRLTGCTRVERGEKLVFLGPHEEMIQKGVQRAVEVDDKSAVLVRNKRSGQLELVAKKQLFFPTEDEEVVEVRELIKLADYEACIVRDRTGKDTFFFGRNPEQRSFFLPPHSELVTLLWSRGRRRERRDLSITMIDLRPMYMSFEFNCRTADNVELILEGSFFWEIVDLEAMLRFTCDTSGDICNHARSKFIEFVSKVKLQQFMSDFNTIAEEVYKSDDLFYSQRGVHIHSLEVTGYKCAEGSTARVLEQIIQETTNRINRLQQQESENEVQLHQIRGDIEEEAAKKELLSIQTENNNARAKMEGLAEAARVTSFIEGLRADVPDLSARITMWNTLRKGDVLGNLARGTAKLYFTPADANISIENHEHEHGASEASEYAKC